MTETLTLNPTGFRELDGEELFAVDGGITASQFFGIVQVATAIGCAALAIMTVPATGGLSAIIFWGTTAGNIANGMSLIFG
jgi:hypothetical protein